MTDTVDDNVRKLRAAALTKSIGQAAARDRKDRAEATAAPDARKAREVVRQMGTDSLLHLGQALSKVLSEPAARTAMAEAVERFVQANAVYAREELKGADWFLHWAGGFDGGSHMLPDLSQKTDIPHKIEIGAAWNNLLRHVNEATKCGIVRRHRLRPIELLADPDLTLPRSPLVNGVSWDD